MKYILVYFLSLSTLAHDFSNKEPLRKYFLQMSVASHLIVGTPIEVSKGMYNIKIKEILFSKNDLKEGDDIVFYNFLSFYGASVSIYKEQILMLNYDSDLKKYFLRPYDLAAVRLEEYEDNASRHKFFKEWKKLEKAKLGGFSRKEILEISRTFSTIIKGEKISRIKLRSLLKRSIDTPLFESVREALYHKGYVITHDSRGVIDLISKEKIRDAYKLNIRRLENKPLTQEEKEKRKLVEEMLLKKK
mgnify:CR=1 FL=1